MDLGLERAGLQIAWQVERDPFCRGVLEERWPDVPRFREVRDLTREDLSPVELLCAGFPCQPVSNQGHKRGRDDERWLWPHVCAWVAAIRPRYVLLENTPGLLSRGMGEVLGDLSRAGMMRSGRLYPRATWERHTTADGCSYWPTPTASDGDEYTSNLSYFIRRQKQIGGRGNLPVVVALYPGGRTRNGYYGRLAPPWVEWLMGFPAGWSGYEHLGTPSYRRLPSGSDED